MLFLFRPNSQLDNDQHSVQTALMATKESNDRNSQVLLTETQEQSLNSTYSNTVDNYKGLTNQEKLIKLFTEKKEPASIILKLLQEGILQADDILRKGDNSNHYTPLYAALYLDKKLTTAQFREFVALGSQVQSSPPWIRILSFQRPEIIKEAIQAGSLDDEVVISLVENTVWYNNLDAITTFYEQGYDVTVSSEQLYGILYKDEENYEDSISFFLSENIVSPEQVVDTLNAVAIARQEALAASRERKEQILERAQTVLSEQEFQALKVKMENM